MHTLQWKLNLQVNQTNDFNKQLQELKKKKFNLQVKHQATLLQGVVFEWDQKLQLENQDLGKKLENSLDKDEENSYLRKLNKGLFSQMKELKMRSNTIRI